ncbi:MAG TPA: hypothetical protein DCR93_31380 [Cytophagales bacterium]|nr:hypothetical protein [Cytophagales bacterium]
MDAEEAYDHYQHQRIRDKTAFECPNCGARVTTVNLGKLRQEMKRGVHYRLVEPHAPNCPYSAASTAGAGEGKGEASRPFKSERVDVFHLERPQATPTQRKVKPKPEAEPAEKTKEKAVAVWRAKGGTESPRNYYSISGLVSRYFQLDLASDEPDLQKIKLANWPIAYREFFCPVNEQPLDRLSGYPRIYWGKAFINQLANGDYQARFAQHLLYRGEEIKPSVYLRAEKIEQSGKSHLLKKLKDYAKSHRPEATVFVYSKPYYNKGYINLNLANFDFFDLREVEE